MFPRILLCIALCLGVPVVSAQQLTFTTIADTSTPNPGGFPVGNGPGTLQNLWTWAVIDGEEVYFQADVNLPTGSSDGGFFSGSGGPITFYADVFTSVPDGTGMFNGISNQIAAGDGVLFFDGRDQDNTRGLYRADTMGVTELLDDNDPIPGGGQFNNFAAGDYQDGVLAFYADNGLNGALYHWESGGVTVIANTSTPKPQGGGNFQNVTSRGISRDQGVTAFIGADGVGAGDGIYQYDGSLGNLVEKGDATPLPGRTFDRFLDASYRDGVLAFLANDDLGNPGIYLLDGGMLTLIADTATLAPGIGQAFTDFASVATANGRVGFNGTYPSTERGGGTLQGVYLWVDGQLLSVADGGSYRIWNRSMDDNHLVYGQSSAYIRATYALSTDLAISARACAPVVKVGDTLSYEVRIDNLGPALATGLMLDLQMDADASFVDSIPAGLCSDNAGAVTCSLADLADGSGQGLGIEVTVDAVGDGAIQTVLAVSSSENDDAPGNNMVTVRSRIQTDLIFATDFRSCVF